MRPPQTMVLPLTWWTLLVVRRAHKKSFFYRLPRPALLADVSARDLRLAFGDLANPDGAFEVPVTVTVERGRIVIERTDERR